jgi:ATP-binding cassette subfamily B protein
MRHIVIERRDVMARASYSDFRLLRRLLRQVRPYWLHLAGVFLLGLLSTPLALLTPLPLKIAVDSFIGTQPVPGFLAALLPALAEDSHAAALILAVGLLVAIALLSQLQQLGSSLLRTYTGEKLVLAFRSELFRQAQRLSLSYHDTKGTADAIYRIQSDAPQIQYLTIEGAIPFIIASFTLAGMIYVTARINWPLALVALSISPVLLLVSSLYRPLLRRQWREVKQFETFASAVVQEVLGALRVVKAFGQEEREAERFMRRSSEGVRARLLAAAVERGAGLVIGLTTAIGTAVVLSVGLRQVQSGSMTLGELLLVMGYLSQLYEPLRTISNNIGRFQSYLVSTERAFAFLDEAQDVPERPNARPLQRARGAIVFRDVSFAYDKDRPVLQRVACDIDPGSRVGIVGATGTGKTTLVSLLTRFYDPADGQILLDGVDLRDYKLADLRNQFAIVLQEPVLFSTSIAENIAYGRPGASDRDIVAAAEAANIHEFIAGLPEGYDTLVGERGMRLSGGERQRISLARAFLKDAPILILDEPTSSVDVKTEAAILEAMERLTYGRTSFIITHRHTALRDCDVLLRVEHGHPHKETSATSTTALQAVTTRRHDAVPCERRVDV